MPDWVYAIILGLVEGGQQGIDRIREAVAVLTGSPARLEHTYALADLGVTISEPPVIGHRLHRVLTARATMAEGRKP